MNIYNQPAGKIPVYIQLKNTILSDIKSGKYPEGTALPAVNVIADNAGVSIRTAYLAVQELIKDGVCFKRPKKGTFVGASANFIKHPVCAVWTQYNSDTPLEHPLSSVFYCGLLQGSAENNITPVLICDNPESVINRYKNSAEFDCKGVIVLDSDKFDETIELANKFPEQKFFFINYVMKKLNDLPPNMFAIVNDNYHGAYKMAEYIIAHDCNDVVMLSVKLQVEDRTYHNRLKGALTAFNDYFVNINKEDIIYIERGGQVQNAFLAITKLLRSGRRPQAIFCVNDLIAEGACQALAAENVRNVMVTGYDCLFPNISKQWKFPTMQVAYSQMVMKAIQLLKSNEKITEKIIRLQPEIKEN